MANDDFMPYEEAPIAQPKRKAPNDTERWDLFEKGYWVTKTNEKIHVSEMDDAHIINVLRHIWVGVSRLVSEEIHDMAMSLEDFGDERISFAVPDPKDRWDDHPFVRCALDALLIRDVIYQPPFEVDLPF